MLVLEDEPIPIYSKRSRVSPRALDSRAKTCSPSTADPRSCSRHRFRSALPSDFNLKQLRTGTSTSARIKFGKPHAIARDADASQDRFDQLETVASIIIDVTERRFWLATGAPDRYAYFEFELNALACGKALLIA